ncbi:MAG: hypothetical protein JXQ25_00005 [Deltaproteobacteria bacterium]|nr:hypothetical protein [Deltaproteobacteria bacterium]
MLVPLMVAQSFIPDGQRIALASMDFPVLRLLVCIALLRIILRNEFKFLRLLTLDKVVLTYGIVYLTLYTLQYPVFSSVVYSVGMSIDAIGGYFVVRILFRSESDLKTMVYTLLVIALVLIFFFFYESTQGINIINHLAGNFTPPIIRDGRLRARGAYPHPILAGSFWAAIIPLLIGYHRTRGRVNLLVYLGVASGGAIIVFCASSTPIMSLAFGIMATVLYYQRSSLTDIKLFILITIVGLVLFWNRPIWYLFAKIDVAGGSTGYFRYLLIDQFIQHWKEWFPIGIRSTYHWGEGLGLASVGLADIPNQYVLEGVRSGILGLSLFIVSFVISFRYISSILREMTDEEERFRIWQIGVSLFVHLFSFMGVAYFGQVKLAWWMTLAIIGSFYQIKVNKPRIEPYAGVLLGKACQ